MSTPSKPDRLQNASDRTEMRTYGASERTYGASVPADQCNRWIFATVQCCREIRGTIDDVADFF